MAAFCQRSCVPPEPQYPTHQLQWSHESRSTLMHWGWVGVHPLVWVGNSQSPKWMVVELKMASFWPWMLFFSRNMARNWMPPSFWCFFLGVWDGLFQGRRDFSIKSFIPCAWSVPSDTPAVDLIHPTDPTVSNGIQRIQGEEDLWKSQLKHPQNWIPSGELTVCELERSTIFPGKIHYFDWAIFNCYLYVHQRIHFQNRAKSLLKKHVSYFCQLCWLAKCVLLML